jgi:hypothetical protein
MCLPSTSPKNKKLSKIKKWKKFPIFFNEKSRNISLNEFSPLLDKITMKTEDPSSSYSVSY